MTAVFVDASAGVVMTLTSIAPLKNIFSVYHATECQVSWPSPVDEVVICTAPKLFCLEWQYYHSAQTGEIY